MTIQLTSEAACLIGGFLLGLVVSYVIGYLRVLKLRRRMNSQLKAFIMSIDPDAASKELAKEGTCNCLQCQMQRQFDADAARTRQEYKQKHGNANQN